MDTYDIKEDGKMEKREVISESGVNTVCCSTLKMKVEEIKVTKLHEDAVLPLNAHDGDAGYDLVAIDDGEIVKDKNENIFYIQYKTGIAIEPPKGYHTEIFPRSSITKTHLVLGNSIGLVDNCYRGEILVRFKVVKLADIKDKTDSFTPDMFRYSIGYGDIEKYKKGDKIAQLVIRPTINMPFSWVEKLEETKRGVGGFGSTGK